MANNLSSVGIKIYVNKQEVSGLTDIPDMGATPEKIDVTTLADPSRKYIDGVKDFGDLEFSFVYEAGTDGNYAKLKAIVDGQVGEGGVLNPTEIGVEFPNKSFHAKLKGIISLKIVGVGVNAAITFTMSVALSDEIEIENGEYSTGA